MGSGEHIGRTGSEKEDDVAQVFYQGRRCRYLDDYITIVANWLLAALPRFAQLFHPVLRIGGAEWQYHCSSPSNMGGVYLLAVSLSSANWSLFTGPTDQVQALDGQASSHYRAYQGW